MLFITVMRTALRTALGMAVVLAFLLAAASALAATATVNTTVTMSDGVALQATITGQAPLLARPVIAEFSPYGAGSGTTYDGTAYNYLLIQTRGTGDSGGEFDALGPRTQEDVQQTLAWACHQPWSDGRIGLNGFSASAITVYNSLHLTLPCVKTAVLRSGTFELYRDLLWPGGVSNAVPGLGVLGLIGAPAAEEDWDRNPISNMDTTIGLFDAGLNGGLAHQTLDSWWQQRGFEGDVNHLPILMLDSFFDVESRGAFQAFQALEGDGAHLLVVGGHDGAPAGTDDGDGATKEWFDHYLLGVNNGIESQPRVQMLMANGSREGYLAGNFVRYDASNWPVPGTHWQSLWLSPTRSGSGDSINDGSLSTERPAGSSEQSYAAIPTEPSMSDQPNTAIIGPDGVNQAANAFPVTTETNLAEPEGLTYTTAPLSSDLMSAGPAALDLRLSSTATETAIWAVISDVWPDGSSHPVATGRLLSAYPNVIVSKSLKDSEGEIVQPYGDYSAKSDALPGVARNYQLEFWPIGNRFKQGDRIRLVILGASAASLPSAPALNTITLGGVDAARLLLPVLPVQTVNSASSCPGLSAAPDGKSFGPFALGFSRARARAIGSAACTSATGIRVGYASSKLLAGLPRAQRHRFAGRVVLLISANSEYSLGRERPGERLVQRHVRLGQPIRIGSNRWYLIADGPVRGLVEVHSGTVEQVGIAVASLTNGRASATRFLRSFYR